MFCFSKFRSSSNFFLQQGTPPSSNPIQHGNGQKIHNSLGCRSTPPVRNLQGSKGVQIGSPISLSAKNFGGSFGSTLPHLVTVEVLQQYVPMDQTFTNFYSGGGGSYPNDPIYSGDWLASWFRGWLSIMVWANRHKKKLLLSYFVFIVNDFYINVCIFL